MKNNKAVAILAMVVVMALALTMTIPGARALPILTVTLGTVAVTSSGTIVCYVDNSWPQQPPPIAWTKIDSTHYEAYVHYANYAAFVFKFHYDLRAPGWADSAHSRLQLYDFTNHLLGDVDNIGYTDSFAWDYWSTGSQPATGHGTYSVNLLGYGDDVIAGNLRTTCSTGQIDFKLVGI